MEFVQVKKGEKTLKVSLNTNTVSVFAKVFKFLPETIYLIGEDTLVFPDPVSFLFNPDEISPFTVYDVCGEITGQLEGTESAALGNAFVYQQPSTNPGPSSGRRLFPPPGVVGMRKPARHGLTRPLFVQHGKQSSGAAVSSRPVSETWRKNIMFSEVVNGKPSPIYQIYLHLTEDTATVENIAQLVEQEVGVRVMLLDSRFLRIMSSESTKGSFWQGSRKVYAIPHHDASSLAGKRKLTVTPTSSPSLDNCAAEIKKMREDIAKLQDEKGKVKETGTSHDEAIQGFLRNVFKCKICLSTAPLPAAACKRCQNVIGCVPCIEQWHETESHVCPLCRADDDYAVVPLIRPIQEFISAQDQPAADNDGGSPSSQNELVQGLDEQI